MEKKKGSIKISELNVEPISDEELASLARGASAAPIVPYTECCDYDPQTTQPPECNPWINS